VAMTDQDKEYYGNIGKLIGHVNFLKNRVEQCEDANQKLYSEIEEVQKLAETISLGNKKWE
jgi:hypothetical protein